MQGHGTAVARDAIEPQARRIRAAVDARRLVLRAVLADLVVLHQGLAAVDVDAPTDAARAIVVANTVAAQDGRGIRAMDAGGK